MTKMETLGRSLVVRKPNETMRIVVTAFAGIVFGFLIGVSFPSSFENYKVNLRSSLIPNIDLKYVEDRNSVLSTETFLHHTWYSITGQKRSNTESSDQPRQNRSDTEESSDQPRQYRSNTEESSDQPRQYRSNTEESSDQPRQNRINTEESSDQPRQNRINTESSDQPRKLNDTSKIWVPTNPRGTERLPPGIVVSESDLYLRRLWGKPSEDLTIKQKYLVTFTVGSKQKNNIDAAVKKFSENFTIMLFHYDGRTTEWDEFEWSKRAIHVSVPKQTKWWYAKRFLHPDIVAPYDYIFIWDEDLGVENFNAEEYIKLVRKHGLEISQPGLDPRKGLTWKMTMRRDNQEVHKQSDDKANWCEDPHSPPCAAFVEIMAPVFSREAWRCVWHMIQNDLIHGWGLDFALRRCVEPAHEKIGVVDAQWIVHQSFPSLGTQGESQGGKAPWEGVRDRCTKEWTMFRNRITAAENIYYKDLGIDPPNSTSRW